MVEWDNGLSARRGGTEGTFRLAIPYKEMKSARVSAGVLTVRFGGNTASFELGPQAERWAHRILRFSQTHTAHKFVIPRAARRRR